MHRIRSRRILALSLFTICIMAILLPSGCCNSTPNANPTPSPTPDLTIAPKVGSLAPDFEATTLDGGTVSLEDLKGKPVLLLFWGTTCGACNANMPHVQAAFEARGEEVNFIAIETGSSNASVQQYVDNKGLGFTVALGKGSTAPTDYKVMYIPMTFFIDSHGIIQGKQVGAYPSADALLAAMEDL